MAIGRPRRRRLALLICNGHYTRVPEFQLAGPAEDARHLAAVLSNPESCRFDVRVLVDRGLLEVRREIARICRDADAEDTLLIYYSGNGLRDEFGNLYLAVVDVDHDFIDATALDTEFITLQLRRSRCRRTVLLIDCCYAGAFFNNNRGIPDGLYAITSCGAEQSCPDTPEGGAFTLALCAGLRGAAADRDGDGRVSIDELHDFVRSYVAAHGHEMTPQKWVWNVPAPIYLADVPRPIFISYAREDATAADRLVAGLEERGFTPWIDREGILSGSWKERVTEGLNHARAVVLLLTPDALGSEAVRKELSFAASKKVPILPVELKARPARTLPDWFILDYSELHRHLLDEATYGADLDRLAVAIGRLKPAEDQPQRPAPRRKPAGPPPTTAVR